MKRRVAVITGASRGIGAATALVLAQRGIRVVVNYRSSASEAEELAAAIATAGGEAAAIQADVTAPGDVARMVRDVESRSCRLRLAIAREAIDAIATELGVASVAAEETFSLTLR